eukprot:211311-Chlamydomonas_euryale.AAC.1
MCPCPGARGARYLIDTLQASYKRPHSAARFHWTPGSHPLNPGELPRLQPKCGHQLTCSSVSAKTSVPMTWCALPVDPPTGWPPPPGRYNHCGHTRLCGLCEMHGGSARFAG